MRPPSRTLSIIVFAQFCCTSLWFASNAVLADLMDVFQLSSESLGHLTSAVQFGFIFGTLAFAAFTIVDRFSPSKVFFICAIVGSIFNLGIILDGNSLFSLITLRFLTGFFLAGIYPVGMKIAADYYEKGLGKSLSFLVGALVLGTAFPHLLRAFEAQFPWKSIVIATSALALVGGLLLFILVPNGPFRRKNSGLQLSAFLKIFKNADFRKAAFGYFGHMWELYAFWAFVPVLLGAYNALHPEPVLNIPLWSFLIVGIGSLGCIVGGYFSARMGTGRIAFYALLISCFCCLASPLFFTFNSTLFIVFLLLWGFVVIADSPLFSTMVANSTVSTLKGTALTITNCIGFAITIVSIELLSMVIHSTGSIYTYMLLGIGPILGLIVIFERKMFSK
ncbi:MAG: MFS transporter [Bacteroidota bacterium]